MSGPDLEPTIGAANALAARGANSAVGVPYEDKGAVYVTRSTAQGAAVLQKLLGVHAADGFGYSVAVGDELMVVGAPGDDEIAEDAGAAYVYRWNEAQAAWLVLTVLLPVDTLGSSAAGAFGSSVAVGPGDELILVGAPSDSLLGDTAGAAYLFAANTGWTGTLLAREVAEPYSAFGAATALAGQFAVVGAYGRNAEIGSVYAFRRNGDEWIAESELAPEDGLEEDQFGFSVALDADRLLIGAPYKKPNGVAYVSKRIVGEDRWSAPVALPLAPPASGVQLGMAVAVTESGLLVGAPGRADARGGAYVFALQDGLPCAADAECASQHCSEGICCDSACGSPCQSCRAELSATGMDGRCGPIAWGAPPKETEECLSMPAESCGTTGSCDGDGQCAFHAHGTVCAPARCQDGESLTSVCDGHGACQPLAVGCLEYQCVAGACLQSCAASVHCSVGAYCRDDGRCSVQMAAGDACSDPTQCASGFCSDGVCCNAACTGTCEACAEAGLAGACVPVRGAPRGDRPGCPQASTEEPCLAAQCDGEDRTLCSDYVGSDVTCNVTGCASVEGSERGSCDAHGACQCPTARRCSSDLSAVLEHGMPDLLCGDYRCHEGDCLTRCDDDGDCAPDLDCNPTNGACEVDRARRSASAPSCAMGAPGTSYPGSRFPILSLLLGGWLIRRIRFLSPNPH